MSKAKIKVTFFVGVLFLLEGYFELCRDFIMYTHFMGPDSQDIYLKAVPIEDEFGASLLFYLFGSTLIVLAGFLWKSLNEDRRDK